MTLSRGLFLVGVVTLMFGLFPITLGLFLLSFAIFVAPKAEPKVDKTIWPYTQVPYSEQEILENQIGSSCGQKVYRPVIGVVQQEIAEQAMPTSEELMETVSKITSGKVDRVRS